jgi:hypothetical protein
MTVRRDYRTGRVWLSPPVHMITADERDERGVRRLRLAERLLKPFEGNGYGHAHENAVLAVETAEHADATEDDALTTASNTRTFIESGTQEDRAFLIRFAMTVWALRRTPQTKH